MKSIYETDATKDKGSFDLNMGPGLSVYKGASLDLWKPFTGILYGTIPEGAARELLWGKISAAMRRSDSPFEIGRWTEDCLPMDSERLSYRWTTNSTNSRTLIVSLVPKNVVLTNGCPYLIPPSDRNSMMASLAVLSSRVFDWYLRRFVEGTMRQGILNEAPFPELSMGDVKRLADLSEQRLKAIEGAHQMDLDTQIDALVALRFNLNASQLSSLYETFHKGWNFKPMMEKTLGHMEGMGSHGKQR
jgi:hypothetical protein